jgi:hypothetical protein
MKLSRFCCVAIIIASCSRQGAADQAKPAKPAKPEPTKPDPKDAKDAKDPPMSDPKAPIHQAPPTPNGPPPEDTARYVAWMEKRGTPIKDKPREDTYLRIGDWGFFDHGPGPGVFADRAGLDRAGHAIVPAETGDWQAFFTTSGVDAAVALKRVAWLFRASGLDPQSTTKVNYKNKITAPALNVAKDGTVTFVGWMVFPPNMGNPMRMTITAGPGGNKLVNESANKL